MKTLVVLAGILGAGLFATTAQAGMSPAPISGAASGIEMAGIVCGPGFHLFRGVCVRNGVMRRGCAIGMRLGPAGVCIR
jgi:hypothetical protein